MLRSATPFLLACGLIATGFSLRQVEKQVEKKDNPSQTAKSAARPSAACAEVYCAETSRTLRPSPTIAPPKANQVFPDPDFGSRIVRVTDENGISGKLSGLSFGSNSSAEINEWGKFDPSLGPHGGYYFYVMTGGGGAVLFSMDAATMQVTPHCDSLPSCRLKSGGSFSYLDPHVVYGHFESNDLVESYNVVSGKGSTIYDFKKCPNLPADLSGYPGAISNSGDDTKFSAYAGGKGQGGGSQVTYYDRKTDHCYWYDTGSGRLGGDLPAALIKAGVLAPPAAANLKSTSGSLPPGDYYVQLTATNHRPTGTGETLPSPEAHIRLTSTGGVAISAPEIDNPYGMSVTGYNVYMGAASGQETRQASVNQVQSGYTQAGPLAKGSGPPTTSSAGYNVHNVRLSRDGSTVKITPSGARDIFLWNPIAGTVAACTTQGEGHGGVASYCGGHTVLGYTHLINHGGPGNMVSLLDRPFSDLSQIKQLLPPENSVPLNGDTHWSWNNADPSDSTPVCGAFSGTSLRQGDGTRNPATNPLLVERLPWEREVVCVATSGPPRVWRFAHHHATGACNASAKSGSCFNSLAIGNISQDGKFFLFSSDWDWTLGAEPNNPGCPASGRCRADAFIVELK
jgi:hypothetical protein